MNKDTNYQNHVIRMVHLAISLIFRLIVGLLAISYKEKFEGKKLRIQLYFSFDLSVHDADV